jgi:hypothetical protein
MAIALIVAASFLYSGLIFKDHYAKRYSGEQEIAAKKTIPIYIVGNIGLYYLCTSIKNKP